MLASIPPPGLIKRLHAAGCVFAEDEARLLVEAASSPDELRAMVDHRTAGMPLEHLLGWTDFCGLRIVVAPGVFVPRRRTEFLARTAAAYALDARTPVVVDMCCGSGAVGAALATVAATNIDLYAVDLDPRATLCAERNLAPVGGHVLRGDLFEPLPDALRHRVEVLVANAPYVPTDDIASMPPEARDHEPKHALDGGTDGLEIVRRIARAAADWLSPTGVVLVETSRSQIAAATAAFSAAGLHAAVATSDELDATVVIGRRNMGDSKL